MPDHPVASPADLIVLSSACALMTAAETLQLLYVHRWTTCCCTGRRAPGGRS